MNRINFALLALLFTLTACVGGSRPPLAASTSAASTPTSLAEETVSAPFPLPPSATPSAVPTTPAPDPQNTTTSSPPTSLPPTASPISLPGDFAAELAQAVPPERDDLRLAIAFRGLSESALTDPPHTSAPLSVGVEQTFTIPNVVDNTNSVIDAKLFAVSDHAYFWFDTGPGSVSPSANELEPVLKTFDEIYASVVSHFGSERNPGIDGDPRLHIVHASPIALCGVTEETADQCSLAGLVNSRDLLSGQIDPLSNEREMFVMNARRFGTDYYLGVLAHEFRHMIEDNYDNSDADWEVEGSATLAAQLAGMPSGGIERGNMFLEQPDQQLNSWIDEGTAPYYGQGYILNRYIYDQLGKDLFRQFATSPLPGFIALDAVAAENDLAFTAQSLWLDYLAALAIHDDPQAPAHYQFESTGLNTAASTAVSHLPATMEEQVSQYAADYYRLPQGISGINFAGASDVSLLGVDPAAGDKYWYAQRANYSNPRLTYALDLRELDQATLNYDVYADIEQGYDFAYVSVSLDDGRTWIPLAGDLMQGLDPADNPAGSALAERFYTGRNRQWQKETIDLSPFAGEQMLLRFEYVTDPILTYGGLALDNIAVPELGLFDGAEEEHEQAAAEGFSRVAPRLPQTWHLQHITYNENGPQVQYLPVEPSAELLLNFETKTQAPSILIVAATAPMTLEKATYKLSVE